jgi:predicted NACHT family NTPase
MSDAPKPPETSPDQKNALPAWLEPFKKKAEELLLSWGATGALLGVAIHFGQAEQWKEAAIAFVGAGVVAVLIKLYTKLDPKLDKLFGWFADNLERWVLNAWWKVTANFQGKYYEQLIFNCRDFRTQGLKTKGAFTLDLEKVFVPLQVAPESADRTSSDMMRAKVSQHCLEIWDFLAELYKQPSYRRIVIIGPPGSGKTTLLEHLTLMYAQNTQRRQHRKAPSLIPVLLYLRTVRDKITGDNPPSLAALIEQQTDITPLNPK